MVQITCPHCGQVFEEDESKFQNILQQMYQHQLDEALAQSERSAEVVRKSSVAAAEAAAREQMRADLTAREQQIAELTAQLNAAGATAQAQLNVAVLQEQNAAAAKIASLEAQVRELKNDAAQREQSAKLERQLAVSEAEAKLRGEAAERERALEKAAAERERELEKAAAERERELEKERAEREHELEKAIAEREDEIIRMRDMKSRLSTKMLGETLEQHCETAFQQIRATAFKNAEFGRDTVAVADEITGKATKGDYIFRDFDEGGEEYISIMFEMKNDDDDTRVRHKNEDFFRKLDEDRRKKGCEYAVLVSLLEPDSELYNQGIVDVSYAYEKMYVIRPQFFVPMIALLRDAARANLDTRRQLAEVSRQNIDVTNFEQAMEDFKTGFSKNYSSASAHFERVIDGIDKTIKDLERTKAELLTTANQLRYANDKVDRLTIRRLTSKNPTMREKFEEARENAAPLIEPAPEGDEGTEPDSVE